jgi:hypothetical protein
MRSFVQHSVGMDGGHAEWQRMQDGRSLRKNEAKIDPAFKEGTRKNPGNKRDFYIFGKGLGGCMFRELSTCLYVRLALSTNGNFVLVCYTRTSKSTKTLVRRLCYAPSIIMFDLHRPTIAKSCHWKRIVPSSLFCSLHASCFIRQGRHI